MVVNIVNLCRWWMWKRNISICNYFISGYWKSTYWKYTKCSVPHVWAESKCSCLVGHLLSSPSLLSKKLWTWLIKQPQEGVLARSLYCSRVLRSESKKSWFLVCPAIFGCESHLTICRYISCAVGAKRDQSAGRRLPTDKPHPNPPQPTTTHNPPCLPKAQW